MRVTSNQLKVCDRLYSDYLLLKDMGYNVLGVFLQGSQNYDLDYEESDIDTKAIILPTLKDIVLGKSMVSTTHILPSNEHIDIKDIRLMFECFKKQNINFLEILFTKYCYIPLEYQQLYAPMFENREKIAHYNVLKAVMTMVGMSVEKQKALCHRYPSLADRIDKYGFDRKQLHHIIRLEEFIRRYIAGESYERCLIPSDPNYLIKVKSDPLMFSKERAIEIADEKISLIHTYEENLKMKFIDNPYVDVEVETIMNSVLYNLIKYSISKEIKS